MSSSILKDYQEYLSVYTISRKTESSKENESNYIPDEDDKKIQIVVSNSKGNTIRINFSYHQIYKYKIMCKNCKNFPHISINDNYTLNLLCNCKSLVTVDFDFLYKITF